LIFVTLIFLLFSECLRRLYCLSSESGLRSNKMRSLQWLPGGVNPGVADRLCHSGGNPLPFDFDNIPNVRATLGKYIVGLGLEQTKHKIPGSCLERILGDRKLESCGHTRYDEILIRGAITRVEFSC
jgi:hypothetical protein